MPRTDFTNDQKAQILVLDRATCSYSGRSLWIVDHGLDPSYSIDWADHVTPASRGGPSTVENGAAACWLENYLRGNGTRRLRLFMRGVPTANHTFHIGKIDRQTMANLRRFQRLDVSDWYLNRAMWHVWIALTHEYARRQGHKRSRGFEYYANAATKMLATWRRQVERKSIASIEERELMPAITEADQLSLLGVRNAADPTALIEMMKELYPVYEGTAASVDKLASATTLRDVERVQAEVSKSALIPNRLRTRLSMYARRLHRILTEAPDAGAFMRGADSDVDGDEGTGDS